MRATDRESKDDIDLHHSKPSWFQRTFAKYLKPKKQTGSTVSIPSTINPDFCSLCDGTGYLGRVICPSCDGQKVFKQKLSSKGFLAKLRFAALTKSVPAEKKEELPHLNPYIPERGRYSLDPGRASEWAKGYDRAYNQQRLMSIKKKRSKDVMVNFSPELAQIYNDLHDNASEMDFTDIAIKHVPEDDSTISTNLQY